MKLRFVYALLTLLIAPSIVHAQPASRPILADYIMWYQPDTFDGSKTFDVPAAGPYHSDDPATIQHHLALAGRACLDGFAAHWFGLSEPRTTHNFQRLLAASEGSNLRHAIVLLENNLPGIGEEHLIQSLRFALDQWAAHPNYLKMDGRPVIFFEGMTRPWRNVEAARAAWARIRQAVDPQRRGIWFAEGLSPAFNPLFDGLYVYRIDHKNAPRSWLKQPALAARLRKVAQGAGIRLYFADTIAPGFDDTRSRAVQATDVRTPSPAFARDRANGAYYRDTFSVTPKTGGDLLLVKSFNEWIEGTAIEPGRTYGDLYLELTCELGAAYRRQGATQR
jgi:glycoprotein endo-alpha-1,2-mannosidase